VRQVKHLVGNDDGGDTQWQTQASQSDRAHGAIAESINPSQNTTNCARAVMKDEIDRQQRAKMVSVETVEMTSSRQSGDKRLTLSVVVNERLD